MAAEGFASRHKGRVLEDWYGSVMAKEKKLEMCLNRGCRSVGAWHRTEWVERCGRLDLGAPVPSAVVAVGNGWAQSELTLAAGQARE